MSTGINGESVGNVLDLLTAAAEEKQTQLDVVSSSQTLSLMLVFVLIKSDRMLQAGAIGKISELSARHPRPWKID